MPKPNYQHARRQKEKARKARQQDKQQRRTRETPATGEAPGVGGNDVPATPGPGSATLLKTGAASFER